MSSMRFDPADPFPLPGAGLTYAEAQAHSRAVDAWLGLEVPLVEKRIVENTPTAARGGPLGEQQPWIGLPADALLTPYTELREILSRLAILPGGRVIDLGAGYGRMAFVIAHHWPETRFIGYELVRERVAEGRRALDRFLSPTQREEIRLEEADLRSAEFVLPDADAYFLYDYGSAEAVEKTLQDLRALASAPERARRGFTVVGRGRLSRHLIERKHPWLSAVVPPRHFGHYSFYCSA